MLDISNKSPPEPREGSPVVLDRSTAATRLRDNVAEALITARIIILTILAPAQFGCWAAASLSNYDLSRSVVAVVASLAAITLSFVGLIVVLRLALADQQLQARAAANENAASGTVVFIQPSAQTIRRAAVLAAAAMVVIASYLLAGCAGNYLFGADLLSVCDAKGLDAIVSRWPKFGVAMWQVTVPALVVETVSTAFAR